MNQRQVVSLRPYLDVMHRHWLASICSLMVGLGITACLLLLLPDMYESATVILIQPQQVAQSYIAAPSASDTMNRVRILSTEALSRARLEEVVKTFDLYPRERAAHEPMDEIVEYMRNHMTIDFGGRDQAKNTNRLNSFKLAFEYPNPLLAQKVTARIADIYVNEDIRQRSQQANAASSFLHDQVQAAQRQLAQKGDEIKAYKTRNNGSLPEDLDSNLKQLEQLQVQLGSAEQALQNLDLESPETRLAKARTVLLQLKARYSNAHPDVIAVEQQVKALEAAQAAEEKAAKTRSQATAGAPLQRRVRQLQSAIETYSGRIAITPKHEQELGALSRDYAVLQKNYESLLNKELDARVEAQLQERQEGERFRILDPATLPVDPVRPDRTAIAGLGVVLSLLAAIAMPFAIYFTDTSFHDSDELARECDLPVLVSVPSIESETGRWRQWLLILRAVAASSVTVTVAGVAIWIYATRIF
jgi:succinoglycan biosynthesis transport protein ExoP